jgi:dTDP-4-amino-4,6-dideoxygalactose transaminase
MLKLSTTLSQLHNKEYGYVTGSGTTAIYIALKSLGLCKRYVALPNNVCHSVPIAVLLSENTPLYFDIDRDNLGLSLSSLQQCAIQPEAVIAVHAYGYPCDIQRISAYCHDRGTPLIEDCAVALGASIDDKPAGSFGDISILSFGAGKIIDVGHGGALLTNDKSLFKEFEKIDVALPPLSPIHKEQIEALGQFHKNLYNTYFLDGLLEQCLSFREKTLETMGNFLFRFSEAFTDRILDELRGLRGNVSSRLSKSQKLFELLKGGMEFFDFSYPPKGSTVWRFNLFIKRKRNLLFKYLLQRGYKVSSWYPSVDRFLGDYVDKKVTTPTSDWVGEHILNVWVNDEIDDSYLHTIAKEILQFFSRKTYDH